MFGNMTRHRLECLIYLLNRWKLKLKRNKRNKAVKRMLINYVRYPNKVMVIGKSKVYIRAKWLIRPAPISGFMYM